MNKEQRQKPAILNRLQKNGIPYTTAEMEELRGWLNMGIPNLVPVEAVKDDSGHWYVIPASMAEEFSELLNISIGESEQAQEAEDKFIEKFSQYMTGGDLNNIQLYAATGNAYGESLMPRIIETPADVLGEVMKNESVQEYLKKGQLLRDKILGKENPILPKQNPEFLKKDDQGLYKLYATGEWEPKKLSALEMVEEFHTAFNCPVLKVPAIPDMMGFAHQNFISELEMILEKMKALKDRSRVALRAKLILQEFIELYTALYKGDLLQALDGLSDILYVTYGTHHELGLASVAKAAFAEVHRSNMSKLNGDGTPIVRNDGKILKGPNFTPPDLARIIDRFTRGEDFGISAELGANMPKIEGLPDTGNKGVIYADLKKEPPIHPDVKKVMDEVTKLNQDHKERIEEIKEAERLAHPEKYRPKDGE